MTVNIRGLGKITASKDVLNILSTTFDCASIYGFQNNNETLSKMYSEFSPEIFIALEKTGYYK